MDAAIRNYGREDVDYSTWYSRWMKDLARTKTRTELESLLGTSAKEAKAGAAAHLRAIDATASMGGQSQRRAHSRNVVAAAGEYRIAISGALEIYDLFPEHTRGAEEGPDSNRGASQGEVATRHDPAQDMAHGSAASGVSAQLPLNRHAAVTK